VLFSSRARKISFTALFAACATALAALFGAGPAAAASYTLLTFPDNGQTAVYTFINSAASSIHMWMYELNDSTAEADLVARAKAGVSVKVILDGKHTSYNSAAYTYLTDNGVSVVYSSSTYYYTHEKSIIVDSSKILVLSENLTSEYYSADRNFGVIDTDSSDVSAAETVFTADYAKTSVTPGDGDNLVWSPTDARSRLLALINGATKTLDVYALELGDSGIVSALVARANAGVTVRVVAEYSSSYTGNYSKIKAAGGSVRYYTSSDSLYVHAKGVVADLGTGSAKVFTGSQNWSSTSLGSNRELGLIISDSAVASGLDAAFVTDYDGGTAY
jgi:phosphatidylserine/phosphatidylglycerophosphate/cardiolipin synthase-like enzyme